MRRETFREGQKVLTCDRENLQGNIKMKKGQFVNEEVVKAVLPGDSYLVQNYKTGKITKRRHYDMKDGTLVAEALKGGCYLVPPIHVIK